MSLILWGVNSAQAHNRSTVRKAFSNGSRRTSLTSEHCFVIPSALIDVSPPYSFQTPKDARGKERSSPA